MRTTVDIPDALYRELKSTAAREKRSVKEDDRILLMDEPPLMEASFRALSQQQRPSPKD